MSQKHEVVIIGAGVIGCSIAYHLAKKGVTSVIIEKESIGCRASGKAWAVIEYPAYYLALQSIPYAMWSMPEDETIAHWQDLFWSAYYRMHDLSMDLLEKAKIDIEFGVGPLTLIAATDRSENYIKQIMAYLKKHEYSEYKWLNSDSLKAIYPRINPEVRGGLSLPQIQVEPYKYTLGLGQAAEAMGAEIKSGDVVDFEKKGGRITAIRLASGAKIEADVVVIAMGPWSKIAASKLGMEIPMTIVLEECLRVRPRKELPLHSLAGNIEILSRKSGDVILAGAEVHSKSQYFELKTRNDFDSNLTEETKIKNIEAAMALLPDLEESDLIEQRGDLLAYGPNPIYHKPIMGHIPGYENGYIATRFGGLGIHLSVGTGEVMAGLIADSEESFCYRNMLEHLMPV